METNCRETPQDTATMTKYRVVKYFQPHPRHVMPKQVHTPTVETILETDDIEEALAVLKNAAVFKEQESAWKILIIDVAGGWEKQVEDLSTGGMWVYKVLENPRVNGQ